MKLTTAKLRQIIKEELNNVLNEDSSDQIYDLMIVHNDYGVVGSVSQSPVDYGRYTMNNGVIGIIPPNTGYGWQFYPARKMGGNPRAIFAKLKEMGYQEEGMPLNRSNNSEEILRRMANR